MPDGALGALVFVHTLGAAVWFGGVVAIAIVNRALRSRMDDAARRGTIRHVGRAAAPILWISFALAAASGLGLWWRTGFAAPPMGVAKTALTLAAGGLMLAHMRVGRVDRADPRRAGLLGMSTVAVAVALFFLGAGLRQM